MKNITLIRHGQSLGQTARERGLSRKDPSLQDCFLTRKGIKEAVQIRYLLDDDDENDDGTDHETPKFDLICTSPLTRAIATCILGLGHLATNTNSDTNSSTPPPPPSFVCHPDLAEIGGSIPENTGRPLNQIRQSVPRQLGDDPNYDPRIMEIIDFSLLPPSWPDRTVENRTTATPAGLRFLEWLDSRPERNVAIVCHHNVIRRLLGYGIDRVPNAWPVRCVMKGGDVDRLYLGPDGDDADERSKSDVETGARVNGDGSKNSWKKKKRGRRKDKKVA